MNTSALILMIFSIVVLWGGLLTAVIHLMKNPDIPMDQVPDE